jgi:transcriptional regulator with XRE-family HTH domain
MIKPDATQHNPDPDYLRELIAQTGLSQRKIARTIGVDERLFRMYLADRHAKTAQDCTYPVQFALEALAEKNILTN